MAVGRYLGGKQPKKRFVMVWGLVTLVGWGPWHRNVENLNRFLAIDTTVSAEDITLWQRNQGRCGHYLNDGYADAGRFIPYYSSSSIVLDGPLELVPYREELEQLMVGLNKGGGGKKLCQAQIDFGFDCVFVGGKDTRKERKRMDLSMMAVNPEVELIDWEGKSGIFVPHCQ
jgi:hypothetical protein